MLIGEVLHELAYAAIEGTDVIPPGGINGPQPVDAARAARRGLDVRCWKNTKRTAAEPAVPSH
jgi:hypothetical protein